MSDTRDAACPCALNPDRSSRQDCLDLLAAVIAHAPGDARGIAVFLLDRGNTRLAANATLDDAVAADAVRRIRAAAPAWHRLLRGERGEFVVIAQGLLDGGAVLAAAARLVHAFDDALQACGSPISDEVSIGIAFAPQHGARAEPLLAAAESSLAEAIRAARGGQRKRRLAMPPLKPAR